VRERDVRNVTLIVTSSERAWRLLSGLPTNASMLARLRAIERDDDASALAPNWAALLPTAAPLSLLYALQIVHGLLVGDATLRRELGVPALPANAPPGTLLTSETHSAAAARWRQRFVERGGVAYLVRAHAWMC
jgi:hypothetical protein